MPLVVDVATQFCALHCAVELNGLVADPILERYGILNVSGLELPGRMTVTDTEFDNGSERDANWPECFHE